METVMAHAVEHVISLVANQTFASCDPHGSLENHTVDEGTMYVHVEIGKERMLRDICQI